MRPNVALKEDLDQQDYCLDEYLTFVLAIDWAARVNERAAGDHEVEPIANSPLGISLLFVLRPSCISDVCKCDIVPRNYLSLLYPRA